MGGPILVAKLSFASPKPFLYFLTFLKLSVFSSIFMVLQVEAQVNDEMYASFND